MNLAQASSIERPTKTKKMKQKKLDSIFFFDRVSCLTLGKPHDRNELWDTSQENTQRTLPRESNLYKSFASTTFSPYDSSIFKILAPSLQGQKVKAYSTRYSQAVTHPSTNLALPSLTAVIGREPVFSRWYGRRQSNKAKL